MKKLAIFVLTLTLVLALVGCGKTEPVYCIKWCNRFG